jgi:type IV pilus assembly protein PilA
MNNKGFTLIELLVVVAIIGILAAIAIPQFSSYRQRAFDGRAESDLRNLVTSMEAYFASNEAYSTGTAGLPGFKQSAGVTVAISAAAQAFTTATATHSNGSKTFTFTGSTGLITSG